MYPPPQLEKLIPVPSNIHEVWMWFHPSRLLREFAYHVLFQDFFAHSHDAKWPKVKGERSYRLTSKAGGKFRLTETSVAWARFVIFFEKKLGFYQNNFQSLSSLASTQGQDTQWTIAYFPFVPLNNPFRCLKCKGENSYTLNTLTYGRLARAVKAVKFWGHSLTSFYHSWTVIKLY